MPNRQEWQFLMEQNWAQQGLHPWPLSHQEAPFSILPPPQLTARKLLTSQLLEGCSMLTEFVFVQDEMGSPSKMGPKGFILSPKNSLPRGGWNGEALKSFADQLSHKLQPDRWVDVEPL